MLSLPSNPRTTQPPPCPRKRVFSHFCASFLFWLPPFMVLAPSPSSNKRAVGRLRAEFPISALPERIIVASLHFVQWQASDFSSKRVWLLVCRNGFDLLLRLLVLAFPHRCVLHTPIRVFHFFIKGGARLFGFLRGDDRNWLFLLSDPSVFEERVLFLHLKLAACPCPVLVLTPLRTAFLLP